jgi:phage terminase small subunit
MQEPSNNGRLTTQQRQFCEYYAAGYSGVKAAMTAGYSRSDSRSRAAKLLANAGVQKYLSELGNNTKEALGLEARNIARSLMDIAYTGLDDVLSWDGKNFKLLPMEEWAFEAKTAVKKIKVTKREGQDGSTVTTYEIELESKIAALDSLAKMLGLYQGFDVLISGLEAYGLKLFQDSQGEWKVEKIQGF